MTNDILKKVLNGEPLDFRDPTFKELFDIQEQNAGFLMKFNNEPSPKIRQELLEKITEQKLPENVKVFPPLKSDFGRHIFLKSGVVINTDCIFADLGGIYLDENVLVGPRTTFITLNHDLRPQYRDIIITKPIHVHKNAWIGAGSIILPGVTIGENAIVGAGAVVRKNVPADSIVIGNPAKIIKRRKH